MSNIFKKKIEFTSDEQETLELLNGDGIFFDAGNPTHKRLRATIGELFLRGLVNRGDKAINHYVLNGLGKRAVSHNEMHEELYSKAKN